MQDHSDLDLTEPQNTASLNTLPCELLIQVLKELRSLRQLQAAIVALRDLFSAYESSRTLIRQQVFTNEFLELCHLPRTPSTAEHANCFMCSNFRLAQWRIVQLEARNPSDGLILRACIWNDLLAHVESERDKVQSGILPTFTINDLGLPVHAESLGVFTEWSLALSSAYRRGNRQGNAQCTEKQTLDVLKRSAAASESYPRKLDQHIMDWLSATMTDYAAHRQYDAGFAIFQGVWDHFTQIKSNHDRTQNTERHVFEMIKSLEWFCVDIDLTSHSKGYEIEAQSWQFVHRHIIQSHADSNFCVDCSSTADSLASTSLSLHTASDVLVAYQKSVWRDLPPRSLIFANWSRTLVQTLRSEGKQLEGLMMVWQRLQESRDPGVIDFFDLDWARHVIFGLKEAGETTKACGIQSSVLLRLEKGTGQYFAWGRNLTKAYFMNGQIQEATAIAEQLCDGLSPGSKFYTTWTQEVSKLHKILYSEEEGE